MFEKTPSRSHNHSMANDQQVILIIDDDAADRVLYKHFLTTEVASHQYQFHEASTGAEGLALFEEIELDCVILDYMLPDKNGLDILKILYEKDPYTATIVLTGQGDENIAVDIMKAGAQDYLPKNALTATALTRAIDNAIEKTALSRRLAIQNAALKKAQEDAEKEKRKAIKADKAKGEFLATMSHEIRTPMNGIIGMVELLNYTDLSDKQRDYVSSIRSSGELLLSIINNILDFSKIEAHELRLESNTLEIDRLLTEAIQLLSNSANENRVELILRWPYNETMPAIDGDPTRLLQIFINLIGNAIKFTRDGQVAINVIK